MRVLVTGSRGFVGAHLCKALIEDGHTVTGIDNESNPSKNPDAFGFKIDVVDIDGMEPYVADCDVVIHLAAQISVDKSIDVPRETIETNVLGTQNVLELARKYGKKVIFASSSEVYGSAQTWNIDEAHPLDAQSPYAASKVAGDRLCYAYWKTFGLPVGIVRNFNIFGEYQAEESYGGVIARFTRLALGGFPLLIFGDGQQERDYMHVKDAIQAYKLMLKSGIYGEPINFGTGVTVKIIDLAEYIVKKTGSGSKIEFIEPRRGEVQCLRADITRAKSYGFEPKTDFYADLDRYIEWKKG